MSETIRKTVLGVDPKVYTNGGITFDEPYSGIEEISIRVLRPTAKPSVSMSRHTKTVDFELDGEGVLMEINQVVEWTAADRELMQAVKKWQQRLDCRLTQEPAS